MVKKIIIIAILIAGGWWFYRYLQTPAPGTTVTDLGRDHVTAEKVSQTTYSSNPPTSGPHLETWVKAGIFTSPQSEGELIHSLEHGYIIISYNCGVHLSFIRQVFAHDEEASSSTSVSEPIATGSAITTSENCKTLMDQLDDIANKNRLWKMIVVPRPQLDTTIALTAWGYIDKFDPPSGEIDSKRIEKFINYHRDQGPEKTME